MIQSPTLIYDLLSFSFLLLFFFLSLSEGSICVGIAHLVRVMNNNYYGYHNPPQPGYPNAVYVDAPGALPPPGQPQPVHDDQTANAAADARRLLSVYPFANSTPTSHGMSPKLTRPSIDITQWPATSARSI
jgi:hypothetical protein